MNYRNFSMYVESPSGKLLANLRLVSWKILPAEAICQPVGEMVLKSGCPGDVLPEREINIVLDYGGEKVIYHARSPICSGDKTIGFIYNDDEYHNNCFRKTQLHTQLWREALKI